MTALRGELESPITTPTAAIPLVPHQYSEGIGLGPVLQVERGVNLKTTKDSKARLNKTKLKSHMHEEWMTLTKMQVKWWMQK
jgi:hypothetical protein